jgi:endonuclease-3
MAKKRSAAGTRRSGGASTTKKKRQRKRGSTTKTGADRAAPSPAEKQRAQRIYRKLSKRHPDAACALHHRNAYELLVATILSAQCTDERVNQVTPALFERFPEPAALARATPSRVEPLIRSTGFYRNKAKTLTNMAKALVEKHDGEVPADMEALTALPGVARKTANVILGTAFGQPEGIVVDTHVKRLSGRLGLTKQTQPEKFEADLMALFPRNKWDAVGHLLIFHGRRVCRARRPDCESCPVEKECPKVGVG